MAENTDQKVNPVVAVARAWCNTSLILRIVIGLVIGIVLAFAIPGGNEAIELLGTIFVSALKAVAPCLVFFLVMSALANAKTSGGMKDVIILYVACTLVAAAVAVAASYIAPTVVTLPSAEGIENTSPQGIGEVLSTLILKLFSNPIGSLTDANYLGILVWAVFLGIALRSASEGTKDVLKSMADAVNKIVGWVIQLAPIGICGLVYASVSSNGIGIFEEYGHLILVLVACMAFVALVTNPLLSFLCMGKNPYPLVLRTLKDSGVTAFFTRSSAANIPVNMQLCEKLGLDPDGYGVSIPLGATINMGGAAITITIMAMAVAQTLGIVIDPLTAVILCVLAAVSACGASGVAGGSLLLIPLACSLFGVSNDIAMQAVAIGMIIGVIQDSCETALNSSSDVLFTASSQYRALKKEGIEIAPGKDHAPYHQADAK
ncbi:MAG: serine/threonine transporter SstT [Coriobacteriia bacterium]|nr:serine/threonine transporter SstT [Coriobacteriia bacterium]